MRYFNEAFALSTLGFLIMAGSPVMAASVISSPVQVAWKSGNAVKECQAATQLTGVTYQYGYKIDSWNAGVKGDYVASSMMALGIPFRSSRTTAPILTGTLRTAWVW